MECGVDVLFDDDDEGELIGWKVSDGSFIKSDGVLLIYKASNGQRRLLKTHASGVVTVDTSVRQGKILQKGMVVASLNPCVHAIVIKDMCASCGKDLREKYGVPGDLAEARTANVPMIHHVPELIVSDELARKIGNRDRELLLKSHKLVLLVDLDQTIVHTTNHNFKMDGVEDVFHYKLKGSDFFTKIRPYTRGFLRRMSELYEMHIISYGERHYAHRIAEFLDPEKHYFGHRILSRDELFCAMYKTRNMQSLFPCGDDMISMIDDRPDVWQYSDALIQVKPYRFFKEIGDINAPKSTQQSPQIVTYAEADSESEDDETLEFVATILTKIHAAFYSLYDDSQTARVPNLKSTIAYLRRQVLRDCTIVFSGIVPIGFETSKTEAYRLCVQFGATVAENITDQTTHVIAARWGTSKVHDALKRSNIAIVNPKWLFSCVERWEKAKNAFVLFKADEREFTLTKETINSAEKSLGGSIIANEFSKLPTLGKATVSRMTDEVDEALSEGASDNENDNDTVKDEEMTSSCMDEGISAGCMKRKSTEHTQELEATGRKLRHEDDDHSAESSNSAGPDSDDDMAADVEREFFA